jgi:protein-S-isoprenylcysteine O-methyltransferase Ste14
MKSKESGFKDILPGILTSIFFLSQIGVGLYLLPTVSQNQILAYIGVGLYFFSGIIFGMLPIIEFRRKGGVSKGKSYIHTTKIVDTGIYSIVRHPQYITWLWFAISGMFLFQHWIIILLGIPIIPLTYLDLRTADIQGIKKFGDAYKTYMQKVPQANFILGILRRLKITKEQ